jgi:hypothetical protein
LQVVQRYKQKALFREGVITVGRRTLTMTSIAGLYFGVELGVGWLRDRQGNWANTAAAGAAAGGLLGFRGELRCNCKAGSWEFTCSLL